ncbi:preprotein translocase subunit SecG [Paragemmobacter straminiformis]|uniref:Protein-export membrane protein SecG n=1 Tax=Paragemmobacter straminiformis TaxID=2045119 RepID=A0A842I328_9RHOB|nr:preprotein translocase subunit SecG [Gemmobacter straminiformis]MBC2833955.1 preprotein translocase subunit SecG [Gemmobacter straminiformis]
MENVILTIHLILALLLIGVVLLQRSEGGGLGMGGGGGGNSVMTGRGAASALAKLTWVFAVCFIATSVTLTVLAAQKAGSGSVLDQAGIDAPAAPAPTDAPLGTDLLPPQPADAPLAPPPANSN